MNDNDIITVTTLPELYNHFKDLFRKEWLCRVKGIAKHPLHHDYYGCLGSIQYYPIRYNGKDEEKSEVLFPRILRLSRTHYIVFISTSINDCGNNSCLLTPFRTHNVLNINFEYVNKDVSPRWNTYSSLTREELAKTDEGYNDYILIHSSMTWTLEERFLGQTESRTSIVKYEDGELTKLLSKWNNIFSMVTAGLDKL